jgi:hypothetical protein
MRQKLIVLFYILSSVFCLLTPAVSAPLPTFDDFRRADRERRTNGQLVTAESLEISTPSADLLLRTAQEKAKDSQMLWGAAELLGDWPKKRAMFESALLASGTNTAIAVRYACAAAQKREFELALQCARSCEKQDADNIVPWLLEMWVLRQQNQSLDAVKPPASATRFQDYGTEAARARIWLLEAAGYSPYSARRIGVLTLDRYVLGMALELARHPVDPAIAPVLLTAAKSMQQRPVFIVTELVGQHVESAALMIGEHADADPQLAQRMDQLQERRQDLQQLVAAIQRDIIDLATESEMVQYFDNVLDLGEETAMKKLAAAVRHGP